MRGIGRVTLIACLLSSGAAPALEGPTPKAREDVRSALARGNELAEGVLVDQLLIQQVHPQVEIALRRRGGRIDGALDAIGIVETKTVMLPSGSTLLRPMAMSWTSGHSPRKSSTASRTGTPTG